MCQGLAPLDGGDPDVLALGLLAGSPEHEVYDSLSQRPLPWVVRSRRALTVSLVQLSCRRYQPRGVLRALPWRVDRRRAGSRMVVSVRGGVLRVREGGLVGCRGPARPRRRMGDPGWARPGWAVLGSFAGERWALGYFGGVLEACGWRWGACAGRGVG